ESIAIIASRIHRVARRASAQLAHDVVGAHALGQLEATAGPRHGVVDVLAQDDPTVLELDLQGRALGQAQGVTHRLGQGDLAAFGDGGFHGCLGWALLHAAIIHTFSCILEDAYRRAVPCRTPPSPKLNRKSLHLQGRSEPTHCIHRRHPQWPIPSPPTTPSRSTARPTPTPACRSWANASTSPACPSR